jgi:Tfp pilus assembly protein PilP
MRVLRVVLAFVVLMSAPMVRAQTPTADKAAKPVPLAPAQPPVKTATPPVAPPPAAPPPTATAGQIPPSTGAPAAAPAAPAATPVSSETYVYRAEGRRDPFLTLIGTGNIPRDATHKDGPAGMTVGEISVRGLMQSKGALVAMIQGPDNKTYIVHQGDKLFDGVIKTITSQGLIVIQEVNDPLSLVRQREVRKLLRSLEDAKQ